MHIKYLSLRKSLHLHLLSDENANCLLAARKFVCEFNSLDKKSAAPICTRSDARCRSFARSNGRVPRLKSSSSFFFCCWLVGWLVGYIVRDTSNMVVVARIDGMTYMNFY